MKERFLFLLAAGLILLAWTFPFRPSANPTGISEQHVDMHGPQQAIAAFWAATFSGDSGWQSPQAMGGLLTGYRAWLRQPERRPWSGAEATGLAATGSRMVDPGQLFTISRIEVSQGIQNMEQPVALIAGKTTMVRVYLAGGADGQQRDRGPVWGTLYLSSDNGRSWTAVMPENSDPPVAAGHDILDFNDDAHALRFFLPQTALAGTLLAYLEMYPASGGQRRQTKPVALTFNEKEPFRIAYLSLNYEGSQPEAERIARAQNYMQMIYPLAEVQYFPLPYAGVYQSPKAGEHVTRFLRRLRAFYHYSGWPETAAEPDQLFGWLPHDSWRLDGGSDPGWFNNGSGRVAFGTDTPENNVYQMIMAHEIGHNLGRQHPTCKYTETDWPHPTYAIHDVGFDFGFYTAGGFIHQDTDDFMVGSHCRADIYDNKWISAHNYQKLHETLSAAPATPQPALPAGRPLYLVSGHVYLDGRADLETVYRVTPQQAVAQAGGAEYCLALEDNQGRALSQQCFDLSLEDAARYQPRQPASFTYAVPETPGAARLVLRRGSELLAERLFSPHEPRVAITAPAPGTPLAGTLTLVWHGRDADADPLAYVVAYSPDNGRNWYYLAVDLSESRLAINTAGLPGGDQALFRVMASDGLHTAVATAGPFEIGRRAPQVFILLPNNNVTIRQEQTLFLSGYGHDAEDGLLDGTSLNWSSDLNGSLGSGRRLTVTGLSKGAHAITLSARDSDGNVTTATIQVQVE